MVKKSLKKRKMFKLAAPGAGSVFLVGSFNDWDPDKRPLKADAKGIWKTTMSLEPGVHEYRFVVDGEWRDDPACTARRHNEFGTTNCLLHVDI